MYVRFPSRMCEEAYVNKIMFIYESEKNLKSWPTVSKLE